MLGDACTHPLTHAHHTCLGPWAFGPLQPLCCGGLSPVFPVSKALITMQQDTVQLVWGCADPIRSRVTFHWPQGSDLVTVSNDHQQISYSVEEAHELFEQMLDSGAY